MLLPLYTLADVMTNVWQIYFDHCRLMLLPFVFCLGDSNLRLMLLPLVIMADVIAYVQYGWCYCLCSIWLMLLPCGRCYATRVFGLRLMLLPLIDMADVIAHIVYGWCYCHVAGVRPLGCFYFNLSSGMLFRTSSHMWGRWYLPIFLLRDGLFTLM